jgi:3-hydroxy-5-methyl-1-naphthoate 3-O-methyltransferase
MAGRKAISPLPLMDIAFSYARFKTLSAALELGLFKLLAGAKGAACEDVAKTMSIDARPAEMLLTGCAALGLLDKRNGRYRNSSLAEEFLIPGKPYYFGGYVEMLDKRLYEGWHQLAHAIRTNRPATWDPEKQKSLFDGADPVMMEHFWEAMHSVSINTARALAAAVDFTRFRRLLDVGGGSGAFGIELCRKYRKLRATVYDLPQVTEIAASKISQAGLSDRIQTAPGDFFADSTYPPGHDVVLLSLIMHDWSEREDREILRKCFEALSSGGAVIICELLVNNDKTGQLPAALMSLNMLIETQGGRNYTAAEYSKWLADIGFTKIRTVRFKGPGADGAVIGRKP